MSQDEDIPWRPYQEPLRVTLARTVTIALIVGAVFALRAGSLAYWPKIALLMLWPSFGGHWVELWFLNYLRPRLPVSRVALAGVRVVVWFIAGVVLFLAMRLTATALPGMHPTRWPAWWLGGLLFVGIELVAHLVLHLRGRSSFYNSRG